MKISNADEWHLHNITLDASEVCLNLWFWLSYVTNSAPGPWVVKKKEKVKTAQHYLLQVGVQGDSGGTDPQPSLR